MRISVEISDPLFRQAKAVAAQEGISVRTLIEEGLRAAIEAKVNEPVEPFRLRDASFRGTPGLQPGVAWSDTLTFAYDEEKLGFRP